MNKDGAAIARAAGINQNCGALVVEKLVSLAGEKLRRALLRRGAPASSRGWRGGISQSQQVFLIAARAHWFEPRFYFAHLAGQDNRAFEFAFEALQVRLIFRINVNHLGGQRSSRGRRPGFRISDERNA